MCRERVSAKATRRAALGRKIARPLSVVLLGVACLLTTGCDAFRREPAFGERFDAVDWPTTDNITLVFAPWKEPIWITDDGRIVGFKVRAYFVTPETDKGAFVSGDIVAKTFVRTGADSKSRQLVHEFRLSESEARRFRINKRAIPGYSYGLVVRWPDDLDLSGGNIDIAIEYHALSGNVVRVPAKSFTVPSDPVAMR